MDAPSRLSLLKGRGGLWSETASAGSHSSSKLSRRSLAITPPGSAFLAETPQSEDAEAPSGSELLKERRGLLHNEEFDCEPESKTEVQ
jgi:hypothetical protein